MSPAVAERPKRRKRATSASLPDPVTQYALDVRDGQIIAGRAVRLACARHLNDVHRQRTTEFPYYWDATAARHIINFFPEFLTLENGDPFHLPPWLQFCYGAFYGWKRVVDGLRRFVHGFLETSKGSGKTPSAGGLGLYGLCFDDQSYGEIYSTGFDEGQASLIVNDAIRMANASPDLLEMLIVDKYNIAHPDSGSFFRAMSSQHRSKSGPRPSYVLSDEIHEHRDGTVVSKAEAGFKNRPQPIGMKYTNSGSDKTSYCWQLHQKSLGVLEGTIIDEQWFAYVCHLDPCEPCYQDGYRQPNDGCPYCDDWTDPAVWPKIAPALGIVIQPKYLQDAVDTALTMPSEYALKRRLNFCIWTETHQTWISPDRWNACQIPAVHDANPERLPAAAGLDPSSVLDLTSLVVALRIDDPPSPDPVKTVEVEGMDEHGEQLKLIFTLNYHVELVPFFWMPRDTQIERVRNDRVPYDGWERAGKLFTTPGPAIDHTAIYEFIVKDVWKRFNLQRLGMDQNGGLLLFQKLQNEGRLGNKVVSIGQGKKLSEAFKFMEILIAHRRLRHDGHPVLAMCVANAEPHRDRLGALWIEKPEEKKRIDGVIAAAMAIHQLMALPIRKKGTGVFFV